MFWKGESNLKIEEKYMISEALSFLYIHFLTSLKESETCVMWTWKP